MIVIMLGFGMIIPILPFYVKSFGASGGALGALMATYGLLQFIFAPIWGSLSDRYGRKPILMIGVLGNGLNLLNVSAFWRRVIQGLVIIGVVLILPRGVMSLLKGKRGETG